MPDVPNSAAVEAVLTMVPLPCASMVGSTYFMPRNTPFTFTAITRSHSASVVSTSVARRMIPTPFTRIPRPPRRPMAVLTAVPFAVLGALLAIWLRGLDNDVYFQIGLVTLLGLSLPSLIGGSIIIEQIFTWPGMGRLFFESIRERDYPTIMGLTLMFSVLTLLGQLLADLRHARDPLVALVESDIVVKPGTLSFGVVSGDKPLERRVSFEYRAKGPLTIKQVSSSDSAVSTWRTLSNDARFTGTLSFVDMARVARKR